MKVKLNWQSAKGPKLSDHDWGDLCKDETGKIFLIGDAIESNNYDTGCGCCSDKITWEPIIAYVTLLKWEGFKALENQE